MQAHKLRATLIAASAAFVLAAGSLGHAVGAQATSTRADLAKAYETIANSKFVDLTHSFSPTIPVWHGFGQEGVAAAADPTTGRPYTIADDSFRAQFFAHVGQYGTHIDPPAHFAEDGKTMDQIPTNEMILPLVVFDMTPMLEDDPNHAWSVADIKDWEAAHGRVPAGSFAALRTDMSKDWSSDPEHFKRFPFPAWSTEALKFLVEERSVTAIGHESLDTDATEGMDAEIWLLNNDRWQIEAMTNLDKVPATGALIVATWPKPENGLGFPARVFAIVPGD